MQGEGFDQLLREMIRDEVRQAMAAQTLLVREDRQGNPFDLNDAELSMAERLLPEKEQPILRKRVMAFRLEKNGSHKSASRMRARADNMERQLKAS